MSDAEENIEVPKWVLEECLRELEHTIEYVTDDGDRHRQTFKTSPNTPASAVVVEEEYRDGAWAGVGLRKLQELQIDGEPLTPVTGFRGP